MQDNPTEIRDFEGDNLEIDDGVLNAIVDAEDLVVERYLTFDNDTLHFTGAAEWENEVTDPTNAATGTAAVVAGGRDNDATAAGATVGGGINNQAGSIDNETIASNATVAGGRANQATAISATVGGGEENQATSNDATVGGGGFNKATGVHATVAGGIDNEATAGNATVGGGTGNEATGSSATIPGGIGNTAVGVVSFAAGRSAKANNRGAFVWSDSRTDDFTSNPGGPVSGENTFHVQTRNGARFVTAAGTTYLDGSSTGWQTSSSRAVKTNVEPVDPEAVLAGVASLEVSTWEYRDEAGGGLGTRHMGPMAEDFHATFDDLGDDDTSINSINADGVAFAAIQGLAERLDETAANLAEKDDRIDELEAENERLRERNDALEDRLAAVEAELGLSEDAGSALVDD